jgi:hypothetical protein
MPSGLQLSLMTALFFIGSFLAADDPRQAAKDLKEFSPNHHFFLTSKMKENRTQVYRTDKPLIVLWEVPTYIQIPDLSDDGRHIAASYEGGNILEDNVRSSTFSLPSITPRGPDGPSRLARSWGMWRSCSDPHPVFHGDESSGSSPLASSGSFSKTENLTLDPEPR